MAEYDNTNRGILFREVEKKNDRAPDYTGKINVDGTDYRLAGWIKEGKNGKFMSLSLDTSKPIGGRAEAPPKEVGRSVDGDIPF